MTLAYKSDFDEYKRLGEPEKAEKSAIWQTAIGLQQVDGLTTSEYLIEMAKQNIEGEMTIYEVQERINGYYKAKPVRTDDDRTEEADKVSARIAEILSEKTFSFSLWRGQYPHNGGIHNQISADIWLYSQQ